MREVSRHKRKRLNDLFLIFVHPTNLVGCERKSFWFTTEVSQLCLHQKYLTLVTIDTLNDKKLRLILLNGWVILNQSCSAHVIIILPRCTPIFGYHLTKLYCRDKTIKAEARKRKLADRKIKLGRKAKSQFINVTAVNAPLHCFGLHAKLADRSPNLKILRLIG